MTADSISSEFDREMIRVQGARTNNLKNVSVNIPRGALVVITGPSGSGKSSLAFDTLFAEGQRQYVESMSLFARQFCKQLPRPDVDRIEGIEPTLSLDQTRHRSSRRSTVGTITEIYDYFRLLLARVGLIHCSGCGQAIEQQSALEIRDRVLALPDECKLMVLAPVVVEQVGEHQQAIQRIRREGLVRLRIDGEITDIDQLPLLDPRAMHTIEAVTDRIIIRDGVDSRLLEAIDAAIRISSNGQATICSLPKDADRSGPWQETTYSTRYRCAGCDIQYAEVQPRTFSFNSPYGACPECRGLGEFVQFDPRTTINTGLSLAAGAVIPWQGFTPAMLSKSITALSSVMKQIAQDQPGFDRHTRLDTLPERLLDRLFFQHDKQAPGISIQLQKELATTVSHERIDYLEAFQQRRTCHACQGSRVNPQARSVELAGRNIGQLVNTPIEQLPEVFSAIQATFDDDQTLIAEPIIREVQHRLDFLARVGVGYLTLGRAADTLSGGEHQRVRLASSIGAGVSNVLFVLDEPSIGLHSCDTLRLIECLQSLRQQGNSLIVVEHEEATMLAADHLIDIGPGAGVNGGTIVAQGSPTEVMDQPHSPTGQFLVGKQRVVDAEHQPRKLSASDSIRILGASGNNLQRVDVQIPLGGLCCVTGVSGSGKSTLIHQTLVPAIKQRLDLATPSPAPCDAIEGLEAIEQLIVVDQKPIGRTPRACPATYCGLLDQFRKMYVATRKAKQLGFGVARFSFNSKSGWCTACKGLGQRKIEMNFMPDAYVTCDTCQGGRYNLQTQQVKFGGLSISDVLAMTVDQALERFDGFERIRRTLQLLADVGLGYIQLGQAATTLSGGEAQRIKLANQLAKRSTLIDGAPASSKSSRSSTLYVLDEPTTGLHFGDVRRLLQVLHRLVDEGHSMIVVEHQLDVIASSDWVIDLGPEGGERGGRVMAAGTPRALAQQRESKTGLELNRWFERAAAGSSART